MRSIRIFAVSGALLLSIGLIPAVSATVPATSDPGSTSQGIPDGVRATMAGGNTVGDQVREAKPRADGYRHIDTPRLIAQLKQLHVDTYIYQVWGSPTDWEDLVNEFAPAAQAAGIEVWPYIVPPDECYRFLPDGTLRPRHERGKCSAPYYEDYVAWADAVAELSLRYPVVSNWAIDDFGNPATFTAEYMAQIKHAMESVNPELGLYVTVYLANATNDSFMDKFAPYVAGIIFPYAGTISNPHYESRLTSELDAVLAHTATRDLEMVFLNYTGRHLGSALDETPEDVMGLLGVVRQHVADGKVAGIISYGTPMDLNQPAISSQNKARTGIGRLSLSDFGASTAGDWAAASQVMKVKPDQPRYTVTFSNYDQFGPELPGFAGYYEKQLLVDGTVVWRSDATDGHQNEWDTQTVDISNIAAGKSTVELTFRLHEPKDNAPGQIDVGIDDVRGLGIQVRNGGFESARHWSLTANTSNVVPRIDLWSKNQPRRLFDAVAHEFALMAGVEPGQISRPLTQPPVNNRAMYGAGLLRLSVDYFSSSTERQCASATQRVAVKSGMPRYELGFWQYDTRAGYHEKKLSIDGFPVYNVTVFDVSPNMWQEGQQLIGPIDVTDQVEGKDSVEVTFELCSLPGSPNYPADVGFDNLASVGLDIRNPGFDKPGGWTLQSEGNLVAAIDLPGVDGTLRPDASAVYPGDSFIVEETVTNRQQTTVRDARLSLTPPDGWDVEAIGPSSVSALEPGDAFTASFKVAVPAGEATSPGVTIKGDVTYRGDGGSDRPQLSAEIPVLAPVDVTSTAVSPSFLQTPGDSATVTVTLKNHLDTLSHGAVSITGPPEWTVQPAQQPYQLAGGEQTELTYEITSPPDASQSARFQVATTYDGDRAGDSSEFGVFLEDTSWEFNTAGDAEGWQPTNHLTDFTVADGLLSTTSTGNDPFMILDRPLDIDATAGVVVEVDMQSSTSSNLQVYWGTADAPAFSEAQSALSSDRVVAGETRTYRVAIPAQSSNLTALRVDPLQVGGNLAIDTIRILR